MSRLLVTRAVAAMLLPMAVTAPAAAQAWLPPEREGSVSVTFQGLTSPTHLDRNGDPLDRGQVTSGTLLFGVEYGLTHLLSIDAKAALAAARHRGADRLHGPLDTGIYHGSLQDARLALALQAPTGSSLAVAPYVGVIIPTHDYETRGHSAPGRHLRAVQIGSWVGTDLGPRLPGAYLQGQYAFSFVERVHGISVNRSNLDIEGGYRLARLMTITVAASLVNTHGGVEVPLPRDEHYNDVFPFHDRLASDDRMLVSAGATLSLGRGMSTHAALIWTAWGRNTHSVKGVVAGLSWTFGPRLPFGSAAASARRERSPSSLPPAGF